MADSRRLLRMLTIGALALGMAVTGAVTTAKADPGDTAAATTQRHRQIARSTTPATPGLSLRPAANESGTAVATLNSYRNRVAMAPVSYDSTLDAALRAHANYLQLNIAKSDLNPYTEVAGYPGYTAAGKAIAPSTSVTFQSPSYTAAVDLLMIDPVERSAQFLDPTIKGVAFARTTDFTVLALSRAATTVSPQTTFPKGPNFSKLAFESSVAPVYTGNCPQTSNAWGYPVTAQFDHRIYKSISNVQAALYRDGSAMNVCLLSTPAATGLTAGAVVIPTSPLVKGAHYSGSVTATAVRASDGASVRVTLPIDFSIFAPPSATPGDQTGDGYADILSTDAAGKLYLYKGISGGRFGHGWEIGHGWQDYTWMARTPDVTGDKMPDLLGRHKDGKLYLYAGLGMGTYRSRVLVGWGWSGFSNLTVVGDMMGDGKTYVVAVENSTGYLYRYTVSATGLGNKTQIGSGWKSMKYLASVGPFNKNDNTADLLAIDSAGRLFVYYSVKGKFSGRAQVGWGWNGFTALFSPGDMTGDKVLDLVGRNAAGELYTYPNLRGSWGTKVLAGKGWNMMKLFA